MVDFKEGDKVRIKGELRYVGPSHVAFNEACLTNGDQRGRFHVDAIEKVEEPAVQESAAPSGREWWIVESSDSEFLFDREIDARRIAGAYEDDEQTVIHHVVSVGTVD